MKNVKAWMLVLAVLAMFLCAGSALAEDGYVYVNIKGECAGGCNHYYEGDELLHGRIIIDGGTHTIHFKNVTSYGMQGEQGNNPPILISNGAAVTLVIEGENYLSTSLMSPAIVFANVGQNPGSLKIRCASNHTCTYTCKNRLTVESGNTFAAIGSSGFACGNITFESGFVKVSGPQAIGGRSKKPYTINFNGGTVIAFGYSGTIGAENATLNFNNKAVVCAYAEKSNPCLGMPNLNGAGYHFGIGNSETGALLTSKGSSHQTSGCYICNMPKADRIVVNLSQTSYVYSGSPCKPTATVYDQGTLLKENTHYTVSYLGDNTNVGTGTIQITGIGNYSGIVKKLTYTIAYAYFEIIADELVIDMDDSYTYTGSAICPEPVVRYKGKQLKKGTDYTVAYSNNIESGNLTAEVILEGIGNFRGTKKIVFKIDKFNLSNAEITVPALTYTGSALQPEPVVKAAGVTLQRGTHYTVTYQNNTDAGSGTLSITAVNGTNYIGSKKAAFTIQPKDIFDAVVTLEQDIYYYTGSAIEPIIKSVAVDGRTIEASQYYVQSYGNNTTVGTASVCIKGQKNYTGEVTKTFSIVCNHDYDNGICKLNGCYQSAEKNSSGYYEIGNAGQLFWFAQQVNEQGKREIKGILTADIDLEKRPWTPIGTTGENNNNFRGVFDGKGHSIKGLNVTAAKSGVGFFGEVRIGTVQNFSIYGDVYLNGKHDYVGGVIGSAPGLNSNKPDHNGATIRNIRAYVDVTLGKGSHGSNYVGGFMGYANHETIIENCAWYGTLDLGPYRAQAGVGGLLGMVYNDSAVTMRNCAAYGTIKTAYQKGSYDNFDTIYIGGIVSNSTSGAQTNLYNCIFAGNIVNNTNLGDKAYLTGIGTLNGAGEISNCYYLEGSAKYVITPGSSDAEGAAIITVTAEQLKSGEVAYKLGGTWGQNIGEQDMPVLGGKKVYYGYESCADKAVKYSNTELSSEPIAHIPDEDDGTCLTEILCGVCGETIVPARAEHIFNADGECDCGYVCLHNCANGSECTICETTVNRKQLTLPALLTEVEKEAFIGTAAEAILLPDGVTAVGEKAFADSDTLIAVIFTAKDADIADNALEGSENTFIIAPAGGTVEAWANENSVFFVEAK